jgi:hypothetical protein
MRHFLQSGRALVVAVGALAGAVGLGGCESLKHDLLEAPDPDLIDPSYVESAPGANAVRLGALARLRSMVAGSESTWLFGGLLADEWSTTSTFVQNDEADERSIAESNGSVNSQLRLIYRVRTSANQAIALLNKYRPTPASDIGEMYFARGFAELQLASDFCNGIPLTDAAGDSIIFGAPLPIDSVLNRAVASFDSAIALSTGTDTVAVSVGRAARIGKARALLGLNKFAEAAALVPVSAVPTTYNYNTTYTASASNTIWSQGASQRRYSIGDSLEGNARNLLVKNAIPFFSAADPRLPVRYTVNSRGDTTKSQDGLTYSRTTTLYGQTTAVAVVNGIDARFIEAEAAFRADNPATMMAILNALRATPPKIGEVQPTAAQLPPLTDPGTRDGRINLLFREKAFWTFSRGQRLGDLRRLIRQYNRPADQVFPIGTHYRGGVYGADVNMPVTTDERNGNPLFHGCLDRKA